MLIQVTTEAEKVVELLAIIQDYLIMRAADGQRCRACSKIIPAECLAIGMKAGPNSAAYAVYCNLKCTGTLGLPEAVVALLPVAQDVDSEAFGHFLIGLGTALVTNAAIVRKLDSNAAALKSDLMKRELLPLPVDDAVLAKYQTIAVPAPPEAQNTKPKKPRGRPSADSSAAGGSGQAASQASGSGLIDGKKVKGGTRGTKRKASSSGN